MCIKLIIFIFLGIDICYIILLIMISFIGYDEIIVFGYEKCVSECLISSDFCVGVYVILGDLCILLSYKDGLFLYLLDI